MIKALIISVLIGASGVAQSAKPFDHCFDSAAGRFMVDSSLLRAIAYTESRMNPKAIGPANRNGTYDIGLMQINSMHLNRLAKIGIEKNDLLDACVSIHVGALILAENISRYGYTWNAVGAYNARSIDKRIVYVNKVKSALSKFQ